MSIIIPGTLKTPVLFLVFNRPDVTKRVFQAIREARPFQLFIAADGPRTEKSGEQNKCDAVRSIVKDVDWDCDVQTLFRDKNLGCGKAPAQAISWFFDHVEEGIILEDDCLPNPAFFAFCSELLERYRHDVRIMEIGVVNLIEDLCRQDEYSYFFSEHNHTWGWATWRRAWKLYDYKISSYKEKVIKDFLSTSFYTGLEYDYFKNIFDETYYNNNAISWWDYQWEFTRRINGGLSIVSRENLIVNLGIGGNATHTLDPHGLGAKMRFGNVSFPLKHPQIILPNRKRDHEYFKKTFTTFQSKIKHTIKKTFLSLSLKKGW